MPEPAKRDLSPSNIPEILMKDNGVRCIRAALYLNWVKLGASL
jgi:hypothetical protein